MLGLAARHVKYDSLFFSDVGLAVALPEGHGRCCPHWNLFPFSPSSCSGPSKSSGINATAPESLANAQAWPRVPKNNNE